MCKEHDYQKEANLVSIIGGVLGGVSGIAAVIVAIYFGCKQLKNTLPVNQQNP